MTLTLRATLLLGAVALLPGCAGSLGIPGIGSVGGSAPPDAQTSLQSIATFTLTDLQNADNIAKAASPPDVVGDMCFGPGRGLQRFVAEQQALLGVTNGMTVSGAFSTFEAGRVTLHAGQALVSGGIPQYLMIDCGPLVASVRLDAVNFLGTLAQFGIKP